MTDFLKQESDILTALDVKEGESEGSEVSRRMGYEAAYLLCHRLFAESIKPKQSIQNHVSLAGWFGSLVKDSSYGVYDFNTFLAGTTEAWNQVKQGIIL